MEKITSISGESENTISNHRPVVTRTAAAANLSLAIMTLGATVSPSIPFTTIDQSNKAPVTFLAAESATIISPFTSTTNDTGSVDMASRTPISSDLIDPEEEAIANMSDEEVLNAVMALEGIWADRDESDLIADRSDRIDKLYGPADDSKASF